MKDIILVDLDGTLADIEHRRHFVEMQPCNACLGQGGSMFAIQRCNVCGGSGKIGKPDWRAFFAACVDDTPLTTTIDIINQLAEPDDIGLARAEVWIVSGRSDEVRTETIEWLSKHGVHYDNLLMRTAGDFTPDEQLKRNWLNTVIPRERVFCVFDDRDKVVKMWRAEGLVCYQVAEGDF